MINKLYATWPRLIGTSAEFSFESRIFHAITGVLVILGVFYIPYNFYSGAYTACLSILFLCLLFCYEYYNSRYHNKTHNSLLFGVAGIVLFTINYFANWGINGSTDVIWRAYVLFLLMVSPYRQHLMWLITYIVLFLILHIVAYYYPQLIKNPTVTGRGEFMDRVTAFPLPLLVIYLVIRYIRKRYDNARMVAEEKAIAIEEQNAQILIQKEIIEKADAEKIKLLSIMSHDMRAPLVSIQGFLQLLGDDELDVEDRTMIEKDLLVATNSTMDMLTNLLQWSKSQMEGPAIKLADLNLQQTLLSTLEMCQIQATKKTIIFSYNIPAELNVVADADMLQLVVRNLVSNAIKFTPANGSIAVKAESVGAECKITVSDNGRGIDPEKQLKLFSVNTSPEYGTNNEKGVGLGLTLCKEFTERQNGHIAFESTVGIGSKFFVFVPMAQG